MTCYQTSPREMERMYSLAREGHSIDEISTLFLVERHVVEEALNRIRARKRFPVVGA
jgi:hypothetical protein